MTDPLRLPDTLARLEGLQRDLLKKIDSLDERVRSVLAECGPKAPEPDRPVTPGDPGGPTC